VPEEMKDEPPPFDQGAALHFLALQHDFSNPPNPPGKKTGGSTPMRNHTT